jgi:hypothetical protein
MRSRLVAIFMTLLCLMPGMAFAAPRGTALVIGIGTYDNKSLLQACIRIAHSVSAHLRISGFAVTELIDPGSIVLHSAVGDFADAVLSKSPSEPALIYVCSRAATLDHRIFLLPADATPQAMLRLQTEGTVLRALMNTFTGNNAMLVADLGMSANAADIEAAAQDRPDVLHVALRAGLGDQLGKFGERLATTRLDASSSPDGSAALWNDLAVSLQTAADTGAGIAVAVAPSPTLPPISAPGNTVTPAVAAAPPPATSPASPAEAKAAEPPAIPRVPAQPDVAQSNKPEAREKLASAAPVPAHPTSNSGAPKGSTSATRDSRTTRIQLALERRGFYHGPANGISNPRTTNAIREFQASLGEPPTGGLTQMQIIKLLNAW